MAQADANENKEQREVCPPNVRPVHYSLKYNKIDFVEPFKFEGSVEINLNVVHDTESIVLNGSELDLKKIWVSQNNKKHEIAIDTVKINTDNEQITIPLKEKLTKGNALLSIHFIGNLNDKMKGFYRSKYQSSEKKEVFAGVTQFEAVDARRAFPCWDEPAVKATFTLEITAPKHLAVLSNMPHSNITEHDNNTKTVSFEKTPIMSTYLLAWAIGEFENVESKTKRDIIVRVWTTPGNKHKAEFACEVACKALDFYEKYFDINYPLPKCDMLAVPDFSAGAMENWGLITYREVALLCERDKSSIRSLQYVAIVVCHELAHQWFGNLVTMDWWSQLWLNEGFACFMEYFSADDIFPNWKMWDMFIAGEYNRAFELDGMETSHPIEVEVARAKQADEVFDAISYCKGASIIRMLQTYLGSEIFRKALHKYLKNFQYSNAITNDLWDFLGKESKKPVQDIMKNWTREQGFPMIIVERQNDNIKLTQRRHLTSGKNLTEDQLKVTWNVPISMKISTGKECKMSPILLNERSSTIKFPENAKWIHFNSESTGFYVVSYDEKMITPLIEALKNNDQNLSMIDRVCVIRDTKALASTGIANLTVQLLNLIVACKGETSYPIWDSVLSAAGDISLLIDTDEKTGESFNAIMRDTLSTIYEKLSWNSHQNEDAQQAGLLRPLILSALSKYKHEDVIKEALKRFNDFMVNNNKDAIEASLRSMVFSCAVKYGGKEQFELLRNYYRKTDDPADKSWALRALGYTTKEELIEELLKWILESEEVRSQDKVFPFSVVGSHIKGRELAWKFLQKHWNDWFKKFDGGFMVQHLAKVPQYFVTFEKADEIEKFYSTIDAPQCQRAMQQCVENIRRNAQWRKENIENISKWCKENRAKL